MKVPVRLDVNAYEVVGNTMAVSQKDGLKLSKRIKKGLDSDAHIVVSMRGFSFVSLGFLEAAFGTLAKDFGRGKLRTHLHMIDEGACVDLENLRRVMDNAFKYFEILGSQVQGWDARIAQTGGRNTKK